MASNSGTDSDHISRMPFFSSFHSKFVLNLASQAWKAAGEETVLGREEAWGTPVGAAGVARTTAAGDSVD